MSAKVEQMCNYVRAYDKEHGNKNFGYDEKKIGQVILAIITRVGRSKTVPEFEFRFHYEFSVREVKALRYRLGEDHRLELVWRSVPAFR